MLPTVCRYVENPNFGFTGFDNIGQAFLTIFTSITLEGWVDVMYGLNASWGIAPFNAFYFICLILFGSFFLLNLALAVIWDEYEKAEQQEAEKHEKEAAEQAAIDDEKRANGEEVPARGSGDTDEGERDEDEAQLHQALNSCCGSAGRPIVESLTVIVEAPLFDYVVTFLIILNTVALSMEYHGMSESYTTGARGCQLHLHRVLRHGDGLQDARPGSRRLLFRQI